MRGDLQHVTLWQLWGLAFGLVAYAVAWVWGGHPERLGAGVLLFVCLLSSISFEWEIDGFYLIAMVQDVARLLIFGWLCFRADRWWPFVITGALALMIMVYAAQLWNPAVSQFAVASAHVGIGYVIDLTLLLSVWERAMAGEPAAWSAAWARSNRTTANGRNARVEALPAETAPSAPEAVERGRRGDSAGAAKRSAATATSA